MTYDLRLLYATDLHGNIAHYQDLLSAAVRRDADFVVIGGDLFPGRGTLAGILKAQKTFLAERLRPLFERFRNENPEKTIYLMMGNDDFAANMGWLEEMAREGLLKLLHLRAHSLSGSLFIAGYSCVPPTPFLIKDWERLDAERATVPDRSYQVCTSSETGGIEVTDARDWFLSHNTIEEELEMLAQMSNPAQTIYVTHAPPYATKLDVLYSGRHIGSRAVRKFVEQHEPPLTLHGHIHESYRMTEEIRDRIGGALCINPGQDEQVLHAVSIDIIGNQAHRIICYPGNETILMF